MRSNVGSYDAAARFVVGSALLVAANHGHAWALVGFAVVLTAAGFCPLYALFRFSTVSAEGRTHRCGSARAAITRESSMGSSRMPASPPGRDRVFGAKRR
jgi:hypothetical protein